MPKNTEEKEINIFEQGLEFFIDNLEKRCADFPNDAYAQGQLAAYKYALVMHREGSE